MTVGVVIFCWMNNRVYLLDKARPAAHSEIGSKTFPIWKHVPKIHVYKFNGRSLAQMRNSHEYLKHRFVRSSLVWINKSASLCVVFCYSNWNVTTCTKLTQALLVRYTTKPTGNDYNDDNYDDNNTDVKSLAAEYGEAQRLSVRNRNYAILSFTKFRYFIWQLF